jgi:hypothetical protein
LKNNKNAFFFCNLEKGGFVPRMVFKKLFNNKKEKKKRLFRVLRIAALTGILMDDSSR